MKFIKKLRTLSSLHLAYLCSNYVFPLIVFAVVMWPLILDNLPKEDGLEAAYYFFFFICIAAGTGLREISGMTTMDVRNKMIGSVLFFLFVLFTNSHITMWQSVAISGALLFLAAILDQLFSSSAEKDLDFYVSSTESRKKIGVRPIRLFTVKRSLKFFFLFIIFLFSFAWGYKWLESIILQESFLLFPLSMMHIMIALVLIVEQVHGYYARNKHFFQLTKT